MYQILFTVAFVKTSFVIAPTVLLAPAVENVKSSTLPGTPLGFQLSPLDQYKLVPLPPASHDMDAAEAGKSIAKTTAAAIISRATRGTGWRTEFNKRRTIEIRLVWLMSWLPYIAVQCAVIQCFPNGVSTWIRSRRKTFSIVTKNDDKVNNLLVFSHRVRFKGRHGAWI